MPYKTVKEIKGLKLAVEKGEAVSTGVTSTKEQSGSDVLTYVVTKQYPVNTVKVYDLTNDRGFKTGIAIFMGTT